MRYLKILLLIAASLTLFACGNNSSGSSTAAVVIGTNTMNLQGGKAFVNVANQGGNGGMLSIDSFADVKISTTGKLTTSFTVPTVSPAFGPVHVTVSTDTTVKLTPDPSIVAGDLFVNLDGDMRLHLATDSIGGSEVITGLTIPSNVKLVLPANVSASNTAALIFDNAVEIDGALTVITSGINLFIEAGNVSPGVTNPSLLRVGSKGSVSTAVGSGNGGSIYLFSWGMLINQGTLDASATIKDASGNNISDGGSAGFVELESFGFLYNTGSVIAKGGSTGAGPGGNGNAIGMLAFNGSLFSNGNLDNSGGDGSSGGGGGGQMLLSSGGGETLSGTIIDPTTMGKTLVGGSLTSNGGNATSSGNGGSGAIAGILPGVTSSGIFLESNQTGPLLVSAKITSKGGAASGVAGNTGGTGGNLVLFQGFGIDFGNEAATEGIKLGATVNLSGGTAGLDETSSSANLIGGNGGTVTISNDFAPNAYPTLPKSSKTAGLPLVELVGYTGINLSGGDAGFGGNGGTCLVSTHSPKIADLIYPAPGINSSVPITAKGGAGNLTHDVNFNYRGGLGGFVDWEVGGNGGNPDPNNAFQDKVSLLDNKGAINISGGEGDIGGDGNHILFYGYGLKNTGAITARGGKGTTQGGNGAIVVELHATETLSNTAAIATTGGSGETGGNGGNDILLTSKTTTNSGVISANGGSGSFLAGSGGLIDLESHNKATKSSGALNVAKGGGAGGQDGRIIIDLVERSSH